MSGATTHGEYALDAVKRGLRVLPLLPNSKEPNSALAPHAAKDATNNTSIITAWWQKCPNGNIGVIPPGVLIDVDHGLNSLDEAKAWANKVGIPRTLMIRTGRRDAFGVQFHLRGEWHNAAYYVEGCRGEIRCKNQYGLYAGSIHPISGEAYEIAFDWKIAAWNPDSLLAGESHQSSPRLIAQTQEKVPASSRHHYLVERGVELFFAGLCGEDLQHAIRALYLSHCERDAAKDASIERGEAKSIAQWIEKNVDHFNILQPGDFRALRWAEKDLKFKQAWNGQLAAFESDPLKAQRYMWNHLVKVLRTSEDSAARLIEASPFNCGGDDENR